LEVVKVNDLLNTFKICTPPQKVLEWPNKKKKVERSMYHVRQMKQRQSLHSKPTRIWEYNIKLDFKKIGL